MWLLIDRVKEKFFRYYRKKVFLARIRCKNVKSCNVLGNVYVNASNVKIGKNVTIYPNVMFWGDGEIVIGDNVDIGNDTIIFSSKSGGGISIGNNVAIAAHCYIIDSDHGMNKKDLIRNQNLVSGKISIGNDVWIADNCTILKNSTINDGAVIGAKSLVNKEIERFGIAVGVPAKVIKTR
ncbi:acyltransferase [Neobacillus drentensis]|uniref:acyltransferase n=1 Tax=Neobacillus drentensis TaxID=220684 RepID=UPI003000C2D4